MPKVMGLNGWKAEQCRSLDVNRLHREGCLRAGWRGNWVWSNNGEELARIGMKAHAGRLVLDYRVRQCGDEWEPITETVHIIHADCYYGSQRPYFACPGVVDGHTCGRRVCKLFLSRLYFLCRHCNNVTYTSQSEPRYDRMLRRANKIRIALGGEPGTAHWIAPKPNGMWQRTYERQRFEIEWCENQANRLFIAKFQHLLSMDELEMYFGT